MNDLIILFGTTFGIIHIWMWSMIVKDSYRELNHPFGNKRQLREWDEETLGEQITERINRLDWVSIALVPTGIALGITVAYWVIRTYLSIV